MTKDCGITLYFRHDCINIRKGTIEVLDWPDYVYLYVNRSKKQLFIQSSTRNKDAFRVYYKLGEQEKREEKLVEQFIFNLGWCEVDDVISNTLGAMIGWGVIKQISRKVEMTPH